jgi:hypothetical protein
LPSQVLISDFLPFTRYSMLLSIYKGRQQTRPNAITHVIINLPRTIVFLIKLNALGNQKLTEINNGITCNIQRLDAISTIPPTGKVSQSIRPVENLNPNF